MARPGLLDASTPRLLDSTPRAASIRLVGVEKRFETFHAVRGIDLEIQDGELLVLLGPSGCGKTTTLNMLAGLEKPTAGQLFFGDQIMNDVPPEERDIAMVFQTIALYPHLDVRQNVGFALKTQRVAKDEIARRVSDVSCILGIDSLMDRKLHQLSGGQRQRVAIAKALVRRPSLFLLDEPFSSLDAELRRQMRSELIRIHREVETTMVFVTHDQEEAMAIADRIAVMNAGELVQLGPPLDLYQTPRNRRVARFIGAHPINLLDARFDAASGQVDLLACGRWSATAPEGVANALRTSGASAEVTLGVRPEHLFVDAGAPAPRNEAAGEVYTRQILGTEILYELTAGDQTLRAVTPTARLFDLGQPVRIGLDWSNVFVFDRQSERRLYPAEEAPRR